MREIEITDGVSYNQTIGVIGEHRATELQITLPDDMTTDVDYWIVIFKSGARTIESGIITDELSEDGNAIVTDGILYIKLWRELTLAPCLNLTASAYKMDGDKAVLIASMPLIGDFYFSAANTEGEDADTEAQGMAVDVFNLKSRVTDTESDVAALAEDSHSHANKSTLDSFSVLENTLPTYGGRLIPMMAVDTDYDNGNIVVIKATGLLETADNSEGEPLNVSDIVGAIDKAHEHANAVPLSKLTENEDGKPLYDGNPISGGEITQATETTLGGVKAKARTTESNEIAIDPETGKLFTSSVPVETSGSYIPLVDTLPETTSNGDTAYVKAAYDELTPIPSSEFANEAGYFHLNFAEGWDTAELSPANFNACEILSSTSSQLIQLQLVDAATAYNSLGADTVAIVVVMVADEESVVYIYPISDVPSLGWEARKWYETNTDFNLFTEAETPDISIPNPYYKDSLDFVVADYTEFDKVFTFSRVKKHLSGLYRYKDGWVRIFSDSVTDIDLLTQRVNENGGDRLFLSSNATYNLNTTNSQGNIYVIMPENINDEIDNSILLNIYCDVDKNLIFDENVNIAEIDTTAGYHELIMTYNKAEGKWWVRQTAEEWV